MEENNPWGKERLEFKIPNLKPKVPVTIFIVIIFLVWLGSGFFIVKSDEQAVVKRFGKIVKIVGAGPHFHLPYPIESIDKAEVTKIHRIEIGFRSEGNGTIKPVPKEALMLTGDENIVSIDFIIQYKIADIVKYLYQVYNVRKVIKDAAESAIREVAGKEKIDDILTTEKNRIQIEARDILQSILNFYESGIDIIAVQLQDIEPPKSVIGAFKDVASAKEDKNRFINEAEAYRNEIIPKARAEAASMILNAEAYQAEEYEKAKGETARFLKMLSGYKMSSQITKKRLYLEKMREILGKSEIYVFDENIKNISPFMGLNELKTGGSK